MSTVKIIAVAATLGGLGAAACATTAGSLSGQVWRMKIADDGRLVILDSAVVGEWRGWFLCVRLPPPPPPPPLEPPSPLSPVSPSRTPIFSRSGAVFGVLAPVF